MPSLYNVMSVCFYASSKLRRIPLTNMAFWQNASSYNLMAMVKCFNNLRIIPLINIAFLQNAQSLQCYSYGLMLFACTKQ
jgi:hypothetical protein